MNSDLTVFFVYGQDGNIIDGPFIEFDKAMAVAVKSESPWEIVQTEYKELEQYAVERSDDFDETDE